MKVLYICLLCPFWQLNRSDSDSSTLAKKSLFVRNATERRSLRVKRVSAMLPGQNEVWGRWKYQITKRVYFISSISVKATEVPQSSPVVSCWNINIVVSVQCHLPSNKVCVVIVTAEASSKTLMLSIMAFLVEFELIVELELLSKGSGLKNVSIMKWHKMACAAQKSTPAILRNNTSTSWENLG